jgi:hypothetical protein
MGDHTVQGVDGVLGVVEEVFASMGVAGAPQGVR